MAGQIYRVLTLPLILIGCRSALAAGAEMSQFITGRWGVATKQSRTQLFDLSWQPKIRWNYAEGGRLTGIVRLRWQPKDGVRPADMERGNYGLATKPIFVGNNGEFELREFYYERSIGSWYLTVGKQQVVWGKSDGLKVLDVVDPQSFREFILEDFDQSRIPLWTFNAERSFEDRKGRDWTLQLLWIPDRTYHALPAQTATFAFRSPRLVPRPPPGVNVRLRPSERPGRFIQDSDFGLRLTSFVSGWDFSINYLYQYDNRPVLHQKFVPDASPVVDIVPRYHRTHMLGGTFSRAFGDFVVRGELGYFSSRYFLVDGVTDGGVAKSSELSYVVGLDWSGIQDTLISMQLFQSWLPDYKNGFTRPELDTSFTFLARRDFWSDTLAAELLWITNMNDSDGLVRFTLSHDLIDDVKIWAKWHAFYGTRKGLFGQYTDENNIILGGSIFY